MLNVAAPLWNEIARTETLETAWARKAFRMTGQQILEEHEREGAALRARKLSAVVIARYLEMKPLLLECAAISSFLHRKNRAELRATFPEVTSPEEAAMLVASSEPLTPTQTQQLIALLREAQTSATR